ncbi:MAG: [protein-PII] uridylyltransferase [Hyphomicrobiaceae bacterium]
MNEASPPSRPAGSSEHVIDPPYFDLDAATAELKRLRQDAAAGEARGAVLTRLKALLKQARATAEANLMSGGQGRTCAHGMSLFTDALLRLVYQDVIGHVVESGIPSEGERMAVVATGGYGRGLMAPRSDIDLLFLLPYKQTPWGESVIEATLYMLWDLGLKVGHATRSIDQCLRLAESDMTIRTSLLDARLILGNAALFEEFESRFHQAIATWPARDFVDAKFAERDERHRRSGESRYRVEPNVKDGKGGLRDLHTLHWLMRYLVGAVPSEAAVGEGLFSAAEYHAYRKCESFLWSIRCHLHFLTGRSEDRLSFDVQLSMAERLHYKPRGGIRPVERFMKHYFLVAKEVGELTMVISAALEMKQLKAKPDNERHTGSQTWRDRTLLRRRTDFRIENGRISVANREVFKRNPVNLIRLFHLAQQYSAEHHPETMRLVGHSLRLIDDRLRRDVEANRIFLDILTAKDESEQALRAMNEAGVLGRFIPEFGRVVAMMQFNMYHHYTVDEHLIRSVGVLSDIESGKLVEDHPLASQIIPDVQNRRALFVAQLLHDAGKGYAEDHSIVGARMMREVGARLGLGRSETETAAWLVEHHLDMSTFAQSRDINDPKTIRDFADIVQSPERLRLLLILTVADIRAVGPGVWNGWKGQLLRSLYYETEPVLAGGHSKLANQNRLAIAEEKLRAALSDWTEDDIDRFAARLYPAYWLRTETPKQAEHARLIKKAEAAGKSFAFAVRTDAFTAVTELTIVAPNVKGLLSLFAGACASAGANIMGAHVTTTRDGLALDTFLLQRELDEDDERRRAERIGHTIEKLISGKQKLEQLLRSRPTRISSRIGAFTIVPEVNVSNKISETLTVLEVSGIDRPGLLYALTKAITDLELDINSAHIATYGERAVDVFYVTDLDGRKITDQAWARDIEARLVAVLSEPAVDSEARIPAGAP